MIDWEKLETEIRAYLEECAENWDAYNANPSLPHVIAYEEAAQTLLAKIKAMVEADCKACQDRQSESAKMLNREAAFDEERLRDEVQYWKDKNYELGSR